MASLPCAVKNTSEKTIELAYDSRPVIWEPGQTQIFERGVADLLLRKHPKLKEQEVVTRDKEPAPAPKPDPAPEPDEKPQRGAARRRRT